MGGWRMKFVFLLIVYFAGFATAIYVVVPASADKTSQPSAVKAAGAAVGFKSEEFARSFRDGMDKCFIIGKEAAVTAAKFLQQKYKEAKVQVAKS